MTVEMLSDLLQEYPRETEVLLGSLEPDEAPALGLEECELVYDAENKTLTIDVAGIV